MNRGEIWLAEVGTNRRPVLVLTRDAVLDVRALATVVEITTSMRGLAAEVPIDHARLGLHRESAVDCDALHTMPQTLLTEFVSTADEATMKRVCAAVSHALGC